VPFSQLELALGDTHYRLCSRGAALGEHGRALSGSAAERLIARVLQSGDGASVRRAYAQLTHAGSSSQANDDVVLRWFSHALGGDLCGARGARLVLLALGGPYHRSQPGPAPRTPAQDLLIQLRAQRAEDIQLSGHSYRLVVAADQAQLPNRAFFEALSPKQAKALLETCAADSRFQEQSALLRAAIAYVEPQRDQRAQLLVLQRQREYLRPEETTRAVTPSQVRAENESHWIEFQVLDDKGRPYANEAYTLKLADGKTKSGTTDENGMVHVKGIVSGNCEIAFPKLKSKSGPSVSA
jgi:hypothetical protein